LLYSTILLHIELGLYEHSVHEKYLGLIFIKQQKNFKQYVLLSDRTFAHQSLQNVVSTLKPNSEGKISVMHNDVMREKHALYQNIEEFVDKRMDLIMRAADLQDKAKRSELQKAQYFDGVGAQDDVDKLAEAEMLVE